MRWIFPLRMPSVRLSSGSKAAISGTNSVMLGNLERLRCLDPLRTLGGCESINEESITHWEKRAYSNAHDNPMSERTNIARNLGGRDRGAHNKHGLRKSQYFPIQFAKPLTLPTYGSGCLYECEWYILYRPSSFTLLQSTMPSISGTWAAAYEPEVMTTASNVSVHHSSRVRFDSRSRSRRRRVSTQVWVSSSFSTFTTRVEYDATRAADGVAGQWSFELKQWWDA